MLGHIWAVYPPALHTCLLQAAETAGGKGMSSDEARPISEGRAEREGGSFRVVGIGASAGGLEAVSELLGGLPETTGMAWIVVQHLDPLHHSLLAEILAKKTPLPVAEATEGMAVEPDHVYVIPPNTSLVLTGAVLRLTGREAGPVRHTPIDILLYSLAEDRGHNAIGVILSGTGSDGTLGLKAIKDAGGSTFAQDPASARFAGMPTSAIDGGCVDFTLLPAAIAETVTRLGRHPYLNGAADAFVDEDHLKRIFRALRSTSGVDFTHYKRGTIMRRLGRRMALHQVDAIGAYADLLQDHPAARRALAEDLLIQVTGFFRDPETFAGLVQSVFPALLADRSPKEPLRIWVPGCASGEETYSIAICLLEFLGERSTSTPTQIFGTDVSEAGIDKARAGTYLDRGDVSVERLKRFFVKRDGHYQIARPVRDLCVFARHDVTRDPPFSQLDLVSCRNLLIYLDPALQRRVIPLFHYALKPQGFLVLGPAETIGQSSDLFELVDRPHKIYRKRAVPRQLGLELVAGWWPRAQVPPGPARVDDRGGDSARRNMDPAATDRRALPAGALCPGLRRHRRRPERPLLPRADLALSRARARRRQPEPSEARPAGPPGRAGPGPPGGPHGGRTGAPRGHPGRCRR